MQIDKEIETKFNNLGIKHSLEKGVLTITASEIASGKLWSTGQPEKCGSDSPWTSDREFYGASLKAWKDAVQGEKIDLSLFREAAKKNRVLQDRLQSAVQLVRPMRKRKFDENDGEFCLDRQYELTPFASTYRANSGAARTLKLTCDFSISAGTDAEQIAQYGAFIFGVAKALEDSGITCEIDMITNCAVTHGEFKTLNVVTKVKNYGEYISEERLARSFSTSQFRRNTFSIMNYGPALYGYRADSGLGSPNPPKWPKVNPTGEMYFKPNESQYMDAEKTIKSVFDALGIAQ